MNAKQEVFTLHHSTESLNEARIMVVEFLGEIEEKQRLSIVSATRILQKALAMYERSIRFLGGASSTSILRDFYYEVSQSATNEKAHVTEMFKAVLQQDLATFDAHYQAYLKSLS